MVRRPDRDRRSVAPLIRDAPRCERLAVPLRHRFVDRSRRCRRIDDCLYVLDAIGARDHEREPAAAAERTANEPFEDAALFGHALWSKRVPGIQLRVAKDDVRAAVVLLRARLGENLDPAAAGPRVLRRVRVLVDLDLLDGGRADVQRIHFHAVDNGRHAAGSDRAWIEELRQRRDVVLVEDRQGLEHALVNSDRVEIFCRIGGHLRRRIADRHFLRDVCQRHGDVECTGRASANRHSDHCRLKARERDEHAVMPRRDVLEPERADCIGCRRLHGRTRGRLERDARIREYGVCRVHDNAGDGRTTPLRLSVGGTARENDRDDQNRGRTPTYGHLQASLISPP